MESYVKLIPLLYPLSLVQNEWFLNLYRNLLLSIFIENPSRNFTIDDLINFIFRNYNLRINNIPELEEVLSRLSEELTLQDKQYKLNPSKTIELEENFVKIIGIDDREDKTIIQEFKLAIEDFSDNEDLWNLFYENFCLPVVSHFYFNLTRSGLRQENEILQNYKSYINKFAKNKDEIHERTLGFLKKISTEFFKKHLIACIFFESLEGDIKNYDTIHELLEYPENLDYFLEKNLLILMGILSSLYSIEERIKSSTSAIASILFEDSFHKNIFEAEMNNKQIEHFKKNLRIESRQIISEVQNDWSQIKQGFTNIQSEFSTLEKKVEILKEGINKHSKLIVEAKSGVDTSVRSKHEASIHILKNKNVEVINKITEFSLFFFPSIIILLSAVFFFFNEYFFILLFACGGIFLLNLFYRLLELLINKKLVEYHKAESQEEIQSKT
jgi:hypothetical protein